MPCAHVSNRRCTAPSATLYLLGCATAATAIRVGCQYVLTQHPMPLLLSPQVPAWATAAMLDYVFTDDRRAIWDNNGGNDFHTLLKEYASGAPFAVVGYL